MMRYIYNKVMKLQTTVDIGKAPFSIYPRHRILLTGSCFADNIGRILQEDMLQATVNPHGVMYNPASVMHSVERTMSSGNDAQTDIAIMTLGTNHVYILNETGEIVDNCNKRPQKLFTEQKLTVEECTQYLNRTIEILKAQNAETKVILTVSPIRYAKYGFHESQLSKATLLMAAEQVCNNSDVCYFPAYEIVNDELRDYRFYAPDMIHPSAQAVEYIYERFKDTFFAEDTVRMVEEWQPVKRALGHRPFNADSEEYRTFLAKAEEDKEAFLKRWR